MGTPIGNLEDISYRAIQILKTVDTIAAEDTRYTGRLLHHFQIETPQISYHQHNVRQRTPELLHQLQSGRDVAIVTDAGMPGISDPGQDLVAACVAAQIVVVPIPGPVAAIAGLVASGLGTNRFCFEGFLPAKGKERRDRLADIAAEPRTVVLYESPHRLIKTIEAIAECCHGDRVIVIARELTKRFETFWRGSLSDAIAFVQTSNPRGEYTLILAGAAPDKTSTVDDATLLALLQEKIAAGMSPSQASRVLAQDHGVSRRGVYQLSLQLHDSSDITP